MSLEKYKKDKILKAYEKGYRKYPEYLPLKFLWERYLGEEMKELKPLILKLIDYEYAPTITFNHDIFYEAKREIADLSNILDFIFNKILFLEGKIDRNEVEMDNYNEREYEYE